MAGYTSPLAFWLGGAGTPPAPVSSVGFVTTLPFFKGGVLAPPVTPSRRGGGGHGAAIQEKYLKDIDQGLVDDEALAILAVFVIIEEY